MIYSNQTPSTNEILFVINYSKDRYKTSELPNLVSFVEQLANKLSCKVSVFYTQKDTHKQKQIFKHLQADILQNKFKTVILSGSDRNVTRNKKDKQLSNKVAAILDACLESMTPTLCICYSFQVLLHSLTNSIPTQCMNTLQIISLDSLDSNTKYKAACRQTRSFSNKVCRYFIRDKTVNITDVGVCLEPQQQLLQAFRIKNIFATAFHPESLAQTRKLYMNKLLQVIEKF
jgi:GMP synthase-like glutamine amidotransferase